MSLYYFLSLVYFLKICLGNKFKEMGLGFGKYKLGLILCAVATLTIPLLALSTMFIQVWLQLIHLLILVYILSGIFACIFSTYYII